MKSPVMQAVTPKQQLTLFDATSIIIGIVIGVGIYETSPTIAASVTTSSWLMLVWLLGGVLSLTGALCYAELATRYPEEGGDYVYLNRAWGRHLGFLFAWAGFWIVRPANIGAIAFIFSHYAQQVFSPGSNASMQFAIAVVILLTVANILGVKSGKWLQNILTAVKVTGLLLVITAGLLITVPEFSVSTEKNPESNIYLAMILVLFTYGGWSNISYVAGEVIEPQKNILHSLVVGTISITIIYLVINMVFLKTLGLDGMSNSNAIATELLHVTIGDKSAVFISILICVTCLNTINGMIFTEARVYYALGREHTFYHLLGTWHKKLDAPVWSLFFQATITIAMIIIIGADENAFERLVVLSAPLHWFFFLLTGLALFKFRLQTADQSHGFKVPLYPWLPALFCLSTVFMLVASTSYAIEQHQPEIYWIIIMVLLGIIVSYFDRKVEIESRHN